MTHSLNCRGQLLSLADPQVMGILNITPDSFSDGGRYLKQDQAMAHVEQMLIAGARIIDIGGFSSRPGAETVSSAEEVARILPVIEEIRQRFPQAILSVDTYRPEVAKAVLNVGVHMINDITAGRGLTAELDADSGMMVLLASYGDVPYVLMHMQGTPDTMQSQPHYRDVTAEVSQFLIKRVLKAREAGLKDLVLDVGFGFGKSILHNYQLLQGLGRMVQLDLPILVGLSRKSMMYRLFDTTPDDVLDLSTALHLQALLAGVRLLRVHDVREAVRVVKLFQYWQTHGII